MINFAGKFGLSIPRIRSHGPRGLPSMNEDSLSKDVAPGNVEERLMRRDLYKQYGRRGGKQMFATQKEGRLSQGQDFSQIMQAHKSQVEEEKFYVGKWIDLVTKARESGDMTLQKHLINIGEDYISRLSPSASAIVEPLLRSGPFDKQAKSLARWDAMNPAPQITADPEKEPLAYANQVFQSEDHGAERTHFASGKVGPKRNLISLGGKNPQYAMRDDKGRVSIVTEQDLAIKDFAKKYEAKEGDIISNGGVYGKPIEMMVNGKMIKQRTFIAFPDGKISIDTLPGKTAEQLSKDQEQLADFMFVYGSGNADLIKKHPVASAVDAMESKGVKWDQIAPMLKQKYGVNFVAPKEASWWAKALDILPFVDDVDNGYIKSDKTNLRYFPGDQTTLDLGNGNKKVVYYDNIGDSVYNADGIKLGNPAQARSLILEEESKREKRKQLEEEMKRVEKEGEEERIGQKKSSTSMSIRNPMGYYGGQNYRSMWE